jgi:hypothetical protein
VPAEVAEVAEVAAEADKVGLAAAAAAVLIIPYTELMLFQELQIPEVVVVVAIIHKAELAAQEL